MHASHSLSCRTACIRYQILPSFSSIAINSITRKDMPVAPCQTTDRYLYKVYYGTSTLMQIASAVKETQKRAGEKDGIYFRERRLRTEPDFSIKHDTTHGRRGSAGKPVNPPMCQGGRSAEESGTKKPQMADASTQAAGEKSPARPPDGGRVAQGHPASGDNTSRAIKSDDDTFQPDPGEEPRKDGYYYRQNKKTDRPYRIKPGQKHSDAIRESEGDSGTGRESAKPEKPKKKVHYSLTKQDNSKRHTTTMGKAMVEWRDKRDRWTWEKSCKYIQKADKQTWSAATTAFRGINMAGSKLGFDHNKGTNEASFEHMIKTGTMEMVRYKGEPVAVSAEQSTSEDYGDVILAMPKDELDLGMPLDRLEWTPLIETTFCDVLFTLFHLTYLFGLVVFALLPQLYKL